MVLLLFCNLSLKIKDAAESCRGSGSIPCTGNPPVIVVDALVVLHGLQFCLEEGCRSIEVESDADNAIVAHNKSGMALDKSADFCSKRNYINAGQILLT